MVTSLIKHERVETTVPKAKELRKLADQMVTLAKHGHLHARRQAAAVIREPMALKKLFEELSLRYVARAGGYTRIVRTRFRTADRAPMAYIEYIDRPGELRQPNPPAILSEPGVTLERLIARRATAIARRATAVLPPASKAIAPMVSRRDPSSKASANSNDASAVSVVPGAKLPLPVLFGGFTPHIHKRDGRLPRIFQRTDRRWLNGFSNERMTSMLRKGKPAIIASTPAKSVTKSSTAPEKKPKQDSRKILPEPQVDKKKAEQVAKPKKL